MKVKIFDFEHETDLETEVNKFIEDKEVHSIQYQTSHFVVHDDQIYSFSCLILYKVN